MASTAGQWHALTACYVWPTPQASRYDQLITGDEDGVGYNGEGAGPSAATYANLWQRLDPAMLCSAFGVIEKELTRMAAYVAQWVQYQPCGTWTPPRSTRSSTTR